jgi:hypothetical protein
VTGEATGGVMEALLSALHLPILKILESFGIGIHDAEFEFENLRINMDLLIFLLFDCVSVQAMF